MGWFGLGWERERKEKKERKGRVVGVTDTGRAAGYGRLLLLPLLLHGRLRLRLILEKVRRRRRRRRRRRPSLPASGRLRRRKGLRFSPLQDSDLGVATRPHTHTHTHVRTYRLHTYGLHTSRQTRVKLEKPERGKEGKEEVKRAAV